MAKTETSTIQLPDESTGPVAALWRIVLSEYHAALAGYEAHEPAYHAASKASGGALTNEVAALEREQEALGEVLYEARNKLFLTPAPDSAALAFKMRTLCAYLKECDAEDTQRVEALAADVRSLFSVEE